MNTEKRQKYVTRSSCRRRLLSLCNTDHRTNISLSSQDSFALNHRVNGGQKNDTTVKVHSHERQRLRLRVRLLQDDNIVSMRTLRQHVAI